MWRRAELWLLCKKLPILRDPSARQLLKQVPVISHFRRLVRRTRRIYYRHFGHRWLSRRLAASPHKKMVVGAWSRFDPGWIPTQREFLSLTKPSDWERCLRPGSLDALLAEHVWEHLTPDEGLDAAKLCYEYLKPGGYLRVAVPDGLHPDPHYVDLVKPAGDAGSIAYGPDGNGANHKALYTYRTLCALFEAAGFRVVLYEYFDETGAFHCRDWDERRGTIWRSKRFDPRNKAHTLASVYPGTMEDYLSYCSIILDAVKDGAPVPGFEERGFGPLAGQAVGGGAGPRLPET